MWARRDLSLQRGLFLIYRKVEICTAAQAAEETVRAGFE